MVVPVGGVTLGWTMQNRRAPLRGVCRQEEGTRGAERRQPGVEVRGQPFSAGCSAALFQATDGAISPVGGGEAVLRPFSLVIPFTVQKGQITGAAATGAPPPWSAARLMALASAFQVRSARRRAAPPVLALQTTGTEV